ncbi:MAG TPA: aldo/keto reductase [Candidatus Tyrphobacter sp.]
MREKRFGPTGRMVPVVGQGTWDLPEHGAGRKEAIAAIRRGIDLGMRHLDTAEMYGSGRVEELLGEAIAGLSREQLFVTSKVVPNHATFDGTIAACERSLRRLKSEYLDLYLLHWPGGHPLERTMAALEELVRQGKTRFVGVSNFDADEMLEAASYLRSVPLACNQVLYHLRERGMERHVLPAARKSNAAIVGYTPFGRGHFPREAAKPDGVLGRIAGKHQTTVRAVILAFLTREPELFAIPKASSVAHVEENARAGMLQLDSEDVAAIDAAFPIGRDGPLAML